MSKSIQESGTTTQQAPKESNQSNSKESEHISSDYQYSINNFFDAWEKSISQYRQSAESFQLEGIRSCKKICDSTISAQQEFARTFGAGNSIPESTQKIINDSIDSATKLTQAQSKVLSDSFATARNNIKALNENSKPFGELCHSITDLWKPSWFKRQ